MSPSLLISNAELAARTNSGRLVAPTQLARLRGSRLKSDHSKRISRIRAHIAAGTYFTEEKLELAIDHLLASIGSAEPPARRSACRIATSCGVQGELLAWR